MRDQAENDLQRAVARLAERLENTQSRIVFAESCTAGLVSATLASVPGISRWLCGSAVVYREATKCEWLGITPETLKQHTAESGPVTEQLAIAVLEKTPEADIAVAVTGHLGPAAPAESDGWVFIAVSRRNQPTAEGFAKSFFLVSQERVERQREVVALVLAEALAALTRG
ncbi:CinA family protein [Novipirellula artificiosorum]|uniref:Nicotinamide-nucleotide amidohydrolase PncC n=1 Tax=Novipirellula artificiosorum TaxID=2528016 RepID=A0A5C6DHK4_9BACT|nr:nicotinamide-nucleotide amidohydrolase family protein [Novipirellula artificiosorum]TWU34439.1 Nicotinamide-nucleotide amidohydrolase PncC [Novipirellula artificiosorum]